MIRRRGLAAVLVSVVALTACSNNNDSTATRADVLRNLSTKVITPAYVQLDRGTEALVVATERLCAGPDEARLEAARKEWTRAWSAWNRTRAFRFGPLTVARATADIAFTADTEKVDELLDAEDPITSQTLSSKGADVRGLIAIEHLLFERDALDPPTCAYAAAASDLAGTAAHDVRIAWTEPGDGTAAFEDQLAEPGDGMYDNAQDAVEDLVNGLSMALTEAARDLANAESAKPGERETIGSHGGSRLRDALWSVRASYFGATSGIEGSGVADLVAAVSETADERVRDLLVRADKAVAAFPVSLEDASPAALTAAYRLVRSLGTIVRSEVASELGVTLSLGDADGDS